VSSDVVLVLAADLPEIGAGLPALLDAVRSADCAVMVDAGGRRNPLAAAWQRASLRRALDAIGVAEGGRASALLDSVRVVEVVDAGGWGTDCDTWDDLARARAATTEQETP
jgi:molybdopterin-guanine dinucleotide biosynthesis protein A